MSLIPIGLHRLGLSLLSLSTVGCLTCCYWLSLVMFLIPIGLHRLGLSLPLSPLTYVLFAELVERLDELLCGMLQDGVHLALHGRQEQGKLLQRAGNDDLIIRQRGP